MTGVQASYRALRSTETWLYRLSDQGRAWAPASEGEQRRVLLAVHQACRDDQEGWAAEDDVVADEQLGRSHRWTLRSTLKRYVAHGVLERRRNRALGALSLVTLEAGGTDLLRELAARAGRPLQTTRPPRVDCAIHHLLVVEAGAREVARRGARFRRLWGDEDLRSRSRRGRVMRAGASDVSLPDGRLLMREADAERDTWLDIEILISKYTSEGIQEKFRVLPKETTVYYAPTPRLVTRVERLTGVRPLLLV